MDKRKSSCPVAAGTRAKENKTHLQYTKEFSESQAEQIWNQDFLRLCIGAVAVLSALWIGGVL